MLKKKQIESHIRAAKKLDRIKDEAHMFIKDGLIGGKEITEYSVQQFILQKFRDENLKGEKPIVAVNKNSKFPHYTPSGKKRNTVIGKDNLVMLDIWAREKGADGIFADMTWMIYTGKFVPKEYEEIFEIVIGARNKTLGFIGERLKNRERIKGWEVDFVAREYIKEFGYEKNFIHSTGHSLDRNVHGSGPSLSSAKKSGKLCRRKDARILKPNMPFTIEPGIYFENFGIRSEIDAYINEDDELIITTEVQENIKNIK